MPNIDSYLARIREAVYGEEVRGSIHDAIAVINDEVDSSSQVALRQSIAPEWNRSSAYKKDSYVWYTTRSGSTAYETGLLYRAKQDIAANSAWDDSKWERVLESSEISDLKSALKFNRLSIKLTLGRYSAVNKTIAQQTDNKTCFTSLIPCNSNNIVIHYIPNRPYTIHRYDGNMVLIGSDSNWISTSSLIQNEGGYIAIVFCKSPWADFTATEVDELCDFINITDEDELYDELEFNPNHDVTHCYIPSTLSDRVAIPHIRCTAETTYIPYINGYPYAYILYDDTLTAIGHQDDKLGYSTKIHNKGGYVSIYFYHLDGSDMTSDDVVYISNNFKVLNRIDDIEAISKNSLELEICHRIDPVTKKISTSGASKSRCYTSMIYCNEEILYIPYIYAYTIYLFDKDQNYIEAIPDINNFIGKSSVVKNKGGYLSIVFRKNNEVDFTDADLQMIREGLVFNAPNNKILDELKLNMVENTQFWINTSTGRLVSNLIYLNSDNLVIPYIKDYPYAYQLFDQNENIIFNGDGMYCFPSVINNKGGYLKVSMLKIGEDISSQDRNYMNTAFKLQSRLDKIEDLTYENIEYTVCHRAGLPTKTISVASTSKSRCVTSMIYCSSNNIKVPYIEGYPYIVYLYDENQNYIRQCTEDFINYPISIDNRGGYIALMFSKVGWGDFTSDDITHLSSKFKLISKDQFSIYIRNDYDKPILTILDDDGRTGFLDEAAMLSAKNLTCSFAMITDFTDDSHPNYMSVQDVLTLRDSGFDCMSHTATHSQYIYGNNYSGGRYCNFSLVEDQTIYDDLKRSREFLVKYGLNSDALVWPWGNYPIAYDEHRNNPDPDDPLVTHADDQRLRYSRIAKQVGFKYAVNSTGDIMTTSKFDDMWIPRVSMLADNTNYPLSYYTGRLDSIKSAGGWMILMTHASDPVYADLDKLEAIVDYAIANNIEVLNFKDAYDIKKPVVSIGEWRDPYHRLMVGYDGVIYI